MNAANPPVETALARVRTCLHGFLDEATAGSLLEDLHGVAPFLRDRAAGAPPPFTSGVTPEGEPVELSVSVVDGRVGGVRFIAQPAASDPAGDGRALDALDRLARLHRLPPGLGGARPFLRELLRSGIDRRRSYVVWLGAERRGDHRTLKLYFNPWASSGRTPGEFLALASAAMPAVRDALPTLLPAMRKLPASAFHILGLNVAADGVEAKLYLVHHARGARAARAAAAALGGDGLERRVAALLAARPPTAPRGVLEMHLALGARGGRSRGKASLLCSDLDPDDASVLDRLGRSVLAGRADLLQRFAPPSGSPRRLNFVGIGEDRTDIYFSPW